MATKGKERTIKDVLDSSSDDQRDTMYIVVGAAVNDVVLDDSEVIAKYNALSSEQKHIIDFIVGAEMARSASVKHADPVQNFIAHFGVKGMKWGVINSRSSGGSRNSSSNLSGHKSGGRRAVNAVLGDKTYWSRTAKIAGVTAVGLVGAHFLPAVLPVSAVVAAGELGLNSQFGMDLANVTQNITGSVIPSVEQVGRTVVTIAAGSAALATGAVAQRANRAANVSRALRGNVGKNIVQTQRQGQARVSKATKNSKLRHEGDVGKALMSDVSESLAHYGIKGMKWGFRRTDAQLARARAAKPEESADAVRARTTATTIKKTKSLSSVSDADLNHLINRVNLEKRYSEVAATKPIKPLATTHKGIKILLGAGKTMNTAISFARSPAGRLIAAKFGLNKTIAAADKAQNLFDVAELARPKKGDSKEEDN